MRKLVIAAAVLAATSVSAYAADVTIGAVLPLSGASATQGEDQRRGIELALEKINAEGGVLGGKLNVIIEDSGGRVASALDAAKKLVTVNNVPVVIGEFSSGLTIPMGEYLKQSGRVHINIGSTSDKIRDIGDGSFSLIGLDSVSTKFAAEDVLSNNWKTAAVITPNNAYGQGVAENFKKAFEASGGKVATTILYTEGQTSYRRELDQLSKTNPDVYLYTAYGKEAATINREAMELGLNSTPWYGIYVSMCIADSDPTTVKGQVGLDLNYIGPVGQAYEEAYRKKYNEGFLSTFNGYAYDAVMMSAAAINKAGSADSAAINAELKEIGKAYEGATGEIKLDSDRQREAQPYLKLKVMDAGKVESR